ncbi:MAG: hypothetical protein U1B79_00600 [Candidatus Pacearchaeota archaeon]|nr:hypothetical protein [Nanoarchaeota archaeon]MDZ4226593.1 hypothetical protein [Candidatus Pacearchaeota archaeon]
MGVCNGCTDREFAQIEASMALEFEPKGTKKKLDEMLDRNLFADLHFRRLGQEELDEMVARRSMRIELDGSKYVFSKDPQGAYFWQPATRLDIIRYHLRKPLF